MILEQKIEFKFKINIWNKKHKFFYEIYMCLWQLEPSLSLSKKKKIEAWNKAFMNHIGKNGQNIEDLNTALHILDGTKKGTKA